MADNNFIRSASITVDKDEAEKQVEHQPIQPETSVNSMSSSIKSQTFDSPSDMYNHNDMDIELWSKRTDINVWDTWSEKLIFCWSIFNFGITCYAVGGAGGILPWYYSIKYPFLIGFRFIRYKSKSWHWFLLGMFIILVINKKKLIFIFL